MNLKRLTYFGVILLILLITVVTGAPGNTTGNTTVDPSKLIEAITSAKDILNDAVAGTGVG